MNTIYEDPALYERRWLPDTFWTDTLDAMVDKYEVERAMDFGCGLGVDTCMLLKAELDTYGVDGTEALREHVLFPQERYIVRDLTDLVEMPADLVWCREVAEHLEQCYASRLVSNITKSASKVVYFTAAPPGQIGHQHINLQPRSFWQRLFRAQGWGVDRELTQLNRSNPNQDDCKNGMVLCPR